jgi:hypothetical protein
MIPTEPGIYAGITDAEYHADRNSLSSSGARKLLPPSCPAIFRAQQDAPSEHNDAFDLGHAAHSLILGEGAEYVDIGFDALTTKAAKEARDQARADGKVPLKSSDYARVTAMGAAIKEHSLASVLFEAGVPERSIYWDDPETGVRLRARPDWLPPRGCVDYKTSSTANPYELGKKFADFGYHQQQAFYQDGLAALGLVDPDAPFYFCVQAKVPPYLVAIVRLPQGAVDLGRQLNRIAIDTYAECVATDTWPGYGDRVHTIDLPAWTYTQAEALIAAHTERNAA